MRAIVAVFLLTACTPTESTTPRLIPIPYALDANGVQLSGSTQRIDFGRTDHSAIPAMSKLVGAKPTATQGCASGGQKVEWSDGTSLVFIKGEFRGWVNTTSSTGASC